MRKLKHTGPSGKQEATKPLTKLSHTSAKPQKVAVSRRAVLQRVNRKLAPQLKALKAWRTSGLRYKAGDLFHLDLNRNAILNINVDLESFAREVGALQPWESLTEQ